MVVNENRMHIFTVSWRYRWVPWLSFAQWALTLGASAQEAPRRQADVEELLPVLTRWERMPTFQATVHTYPVSGRVPKDGQRDPWDKSTWQPAKQNFAGKLLGKFRREDYELAISLEGLMETKSQEMWMSWVGGEFVQAVGPTSGEPNAEIMAGMNAVHLSLNKALTPLEHQFFDFGETWVQLLRRMKFVRAGEESIDGRSCWRLENSVETEKHRVSLWLCPDLDYAPVRAVLATSRPDKRSSVWEMRVLSHVPVENSWVAKDSIISLTRDDLSSYQMSAFELVEVVFGEQFEPRSILEKLRHGTRVTDHTRGEFWYADGRGGRERVERIDPEERRKVLEAARADADRPTLKRTRNYGLGAIAIATLLIVVGIVVVKRRAMAS